ncbi:hypothetical protein GCM10010441_24620 [Kitasatospora paracochleata]
MVPGRRPGRDRTGAVAVAVQDGLAQWGGSLYPLRVREVRGGLVPEADSGREAGRSGFAPCLATLVRLSAPRDLGAGSVPLWFLEALARAGHLARAAEAAFAIGDELRQGDALLTLVQAAAAAGDLDGAQALAEAIPLRQYRDRGSVGLVPAWERAGERDRAVALAEAIRYPHHWGTAWALLAKAAADGGDVAAARAFAERAEEMLFPDDPLTARVLLVLLDVATVTGDHGRADCLADRLERSARSRGASGQGFDLDRPRPLTAVLLRDLGRGDLRRLDALLGDPHRTSVDVQVMTDLLEAATAGSTTQTALALAERAQTLLATCGTSSGEAVALCTAAARMLARHGHVERAEAFADAMRAPDLRAGRQAQIVRELARGGDTVRAEALARAITDGRARARALVAVADELARRGETGRAETLARTIEDRWARDHALVAVVRELGRRGETDRAETLTRSIAHRSTRARALTELAEVAEPSAARRSAVRAAALDGWWQVLPLLELVAPDALVAAADAWPDGRPG